MAIKFKSFEYRPVGQAPAFVLPKLEADSQTFVKGDLVVLSGTTDRVSLATAGGANQIFGIAQDNATNVTSGHKVIPVLVIRPQDLFDCQFVAAGTYAVTMAGENHEIVRTSAGRWEVATGTTAADVRVHLIGSGESPNTAGPYTAGGPLIVRFLQVDGTPDQVLQYSTDVAF